MKNNILILTLTLFISFNTNAESAMMSIEHHFQKIEEAIESNNLIDACYRFGHLPPLFFVLSFDLMKEKELSKSHRKLLASSHFMDLKASIPSTAGPCYGTRGKSDKELQIFKNNYTKFKSKYLQAMKEEISM